MRTVDLLIAARDLIADRKNWTQGHLSRLVVDGDGRRNCFCALGAVLKESGCLQPSDDGRFLPARNLNTSCEKGLAAVYDDESGRYLRPIPMNGETGLSKSFLHSFFKKTGADVAAAVKAIRYLEEAIKQLFIRKGYGYDGFSVVCINDGGSYTKHYGYGGGREYFNTEEKSHQLILEAFDIAIKNAKRRHVAGDRKKAGAALANREVSCGY